MKKLTCDRCGESPPLAELDGELLCETCCKNWVLGEGQAQNDAREDRP